MGTVCSRANPQASNPVPIPIPSTTPTPSYRRTRPLAAVDRPVCRQAHLHPKKTMTMMHRRCVPRRGRGKDTYVTANAPCRLPHPYIHCTVRKQPHEYGSQGKGRERDGKIKFSTTAPVATTRPMRSVCARRYGVASDGYVMHPRPIPSIHPVRPSPVHSIFPHFPFQKFRRRRRAAAGGLQYSIVHR